jgi:hypothetical protein
VINSSLAVRFSKMHTLVKDENLELPMYGLSEAALYLRVPIKTLEYWVFGQARFVR